MSTVICYLLTLQRPKCLLGLLLPCSNLSDRRHCCEISSDNIVIELLVNLGWMDYSSSVIDLMVSSCRINAGHVPYLRY